MEFKMNGVKHSNKLKILRAVNVYSIKNNSQGIGDYIRGCFCMLQILRKKNIPFDMDISTHAAQRWLKPTTRYTYRQLEQINYYECNRPNRLKYIESKLENASGLFTFFSNEYPVDPITIEEKIFIRNKLLPSDEMKEYVQHTKNNWGITGPYNILHLRCGDSCLVDGEPPIYDLFLCEIQQLTMDSNPCIVLSDSIHMKERLRELYPNFIISMDKPIHTCHCTDQEQLKDTMRDFFMFTTASNVYAFSIYGHGSGYSEWPCKMYDVPYHAKHIQKLGPRPFAISDKALLKLS
jgi:hypothetical protein